MLQNLHHYMYAFEPQAPMGSLFNIKKSSLCSRLPPSKKQESFFRGQLRMFCKLHLKAQWHTNGYSHPHIVIITIWLYTFPSPHTHFRVLNHRRGLRGGARMQFSLISHHSSPSCGVKNLSSPPGAVETCVNADMYMKTQAEVSSHKRNVWLLT